MKEKKSNKISEFNKINRDFHKSIILSFVFDFFEFLYLLPAALLSLFILFILFILPTLYLLGVFK